MSACDCCREAEAVSSGLCGTCGLAYCEHAPIWTAYDRERLLLVVMIALLIASSYTDTPIGAWMRAWARWVRA